MKTVPDADTRARLRTFFVIWLGQTASILGTGLTSFALGVWVYQETGSATRFTLISVMASLPGLLFAPIAGALVDRWNRRLAMMISDSGAATTTVVLLALLLNGHLEIWHIYLYAAINSVFNAFQFPAFSAAITQLVPKEHLGRSSGMVSVGQAIGFTLAPILAASLMATISLTAVIIADLATFVFALGTLLVTTIPRPAASAESAAVQGSLLREAKLGWTYIRQRRGLFGLMLFFVGFNFVVPMAYVLATPLVLSFAGTPELGKALTIASAGTLVSGLLMAIWGGPRRKIYGILGAAPLPVIGLLLAGIRPSVPLIALGLFLVVGVAPVFMGCSQAIWQRKVAADIQGRVFSVRAMVGQLTAPLAYLVAGPLVDHVFEPLLLEDGALAAVLGPFFGTGGGRGIGLLYVLLAAGFAAVSLTAWLYRPLREVEIDLPDADREERAEDPDQ